MPKPGKKSVFFVDFCIVYNLKRVVWVVFVKNPDFSIGSELPASKETGFRRSQPKDTGFEPAGSLFSCLSGKHIMSRL